MEALQTPGDESTHIVGRLFLLFSEIGFIPGFVPQSREVKSSFHPGTTPRVHTNSVDAVWVPEDGNGTLLRS